MTAGPNQSELALELAQHFTPKIQQFLAKAYSDSPRSLSTGRRLGNASVLDSPTASCRLDRGGGNRSRRVDSQWHRPGFILARFSPFDEAEHHSPSSKGEKGASLE